MNMSRFIAAFVIGAVSLVAQGPGRGIPSLNERQSGALDRMNADLAAQQRTLSAARSAMIVVAYNLPRDDRSIRTKAEAVREAEITLANARVTWRNHRRDFEVSLEVTNLFDKYYYLTTSEISVTTGVANAQPGRPREWAVTLKKSF